MTRESQLWNFLRQQDHDKERDLLMLSKGIKTLRIRNEEFKDIDKVSRKIKDAI